MNKKTYSIMFLFGMFTIYTGLFADDNYESLLGLIIALQSQILHQTTDK